jgi:hypothetical protein
MLQFVICLQHDIAMYSAISIHRFATVLSVCNSSLMCCNGNMLLPMPEAEMNTIIYFLN